MQNSLARVYETQAPPEDERSLVRTLLVDDDPVVEEVLTSILEDEGYRVQSVRSAAGALALLAREPFDVMLADVCMPGMSGLELLERARSMWPDMPIIIITGHADMDMVRRALASGASDFVTKPCNVIELPVIMERNLTRHAISQRHNALHRQQLYVSYEAVLDALLSALDTRDTETEGHSERVTAYTMVLADRLRVPSSELYHIERGALLHDIGKIGVPDRVLHKRGPLAPEEWIEMKKHPVVGYRMCSRIDFLQGAALTVLHHHERWDGSGYPDGLKADEIPLGARIFSVVDAFDAMTTDRPYRAAMPFAQACRELAGHSGTQFDPAVVDCFLQVGADCWSSLSAQMAR